MILFDRKMERKYQISDPICGLLETGKESIDGAFTSHHWLMDSLPKRMIYYYIYGDLLQRGPRKQILDVGGGYCSISRLILSHHDYTLLDIMAHDDPDSLRMIEKALRKTFWINADWKEFEDENEYDLVIANDLFPNVDQRFAMFVEKFLPLCHEMRVSLTYYNSPQFYKVKRLDGDEIFHMLAWDGLQVKQLLEKYSTRITKPNFDLLLENPPSLFANNRQVCLVTLRGQKSDNS